MKTNVLMLCCAALLVGGAAAVQAQNPAYKMNVPYVMPKTAVKVTVTVQKEEIKKGPYAKFAQQYLGVDAPLNDKTVYTVVGAELNACNEADPSDIYILSDPAAVPVEWAGKRIEAADAPRPLPKRPGKERTNNMPFEDMGIDPIVYSVDRTSPREKSLEEMAASAANTIFTLRKRRFDLITGETGENVFGEGLKAAIAEMNRLENEYLALFLGNKKTTTRVYEFDVVPQSGQNNYVPCRFSAASGIVDAGDVSGEPLLLTVTPEGGVKEQPADSKTAVKGAVTHYRIADMAACKLFYNNELLNSKRLPIYQFGATVTVVTPAK